MDRLPVTLILTNEEIDRLIVLLDLLKGDPDAEYLKHRIYSQQTGEEMTPFPLPRKYLNLLAETTTETQIPINFETETVS